MKEREDVKGGRKGEEEKEEGKGDNIFLLFALHTLTKPSNTVERK